MRRLPPLNALRAFEAAARLRSFTGAARELSVTQGAVSRHVLLLERWLGTALFARTRRGVELTPEGSRYFATVAGALERVEQETQRLLAKASGNTLRLKLPPTFAIRWLVPRLARFHALNRHIDVQITTSHQPVDFNREDVDACIHAGSPPAGLAAHRLFGEVLLAVASPNLLRRTGGLRAPEDLGSQVLLCSLHRPDDWPLWMRTAGVEGIDGNSGLKFENSALAYQAAIDELGIAVAQLAFVADDLATGRLREASPHRTATDQAYFIAVPADRTPSPAVSAFVGWLVGEAAVERRISG